MKSFFKTKSSFEKKEMDKKKINFSYSALQGNVNYLCYTQSKSNCPKIVKKTEILLLSDSIIFSILYNNFFYTQLAFVFDFQKDFYIVYDNTRYLHRASFRSLFLFFNIYLSFLYVEEKIYIICFTSFFTCFKN